MATRNPMQQEWLRISNRPDVPPAEDQRPFPLFLPGLQARPWWDPSDVPWTAAFAENFPAIRDEARAVVKSGQLAPKPVVDIPPAERKGDDLLIDGERGGWAIFRLSYYGALIQDNAVRCPTTARLIEGVPRLTGTAGIAVMLPGTHLNPHCGHTNGKIRCHLGLDVPPGCRLRVGKESRTWEAGKWLIFDDSFEHEVWHDGDDVRIVLILDVYHPDLTDREIAWLDKLAKLMT